MDRIEKSAPTRSTLEKRESDEARIQSELAGTEGGIDPFAAAVRATRMAMIVTDPRQPDNPIVFANDAFYRLTGYAQAEVIGRNCRFLQGPDTDPKDVARIREAVAARKTIELDVRNYKKDGTPFWNRLLMAPVYDTGEQLTYFFASQMDVTVERERLSVLEGENASLKAAREVNQARLDLSEASLRLATDAAEIGTWDLDLLTGILTWSDRTKAMFGISPGVPCSMEDFYAGLYPDDKQATSQAFEAALDPDRRLTYDVEYRTIGKEDSVIRWVAAKGRGLFDQHARCVRAVGTAIDISKRKATEERLIASEAALRDLNARLEAEVVKRTAELRLYGDIFQSSAAPICAFDTKYRLIAFNRAHSDEFYRVFGYPVQLGDVLPDRFPPDQAPVIRALMDRALTGEAYTVTEEFGDPDLAKPVWEISYSPLRDASGQLIGAFHHAKDISARIHAEAELASTQDALRQAQKMEAVGQLTGGLAHDFNNLLAVISGSLELLENRIAQGRMNDIDRYISAAQGAAKRASSLTHRLLAFSRRQTLDPKPTILNSLIVSMDELIRRTVGPAVAVEVVGAGGLWTTMVDPHQLENALLNLCINARDAMPEGGKLTIETANRWLDDRAARERDLPAGQYVSMCVSDTGTGMSPDLIAKVFEPFFTTKPIGQGTGLGLSMIYGFARQSGGQVRIYSEVGEGTMVCLYLPRHYGEGVENEDSVTITPPRATEGETVLIVDDEAAVRMLIYDVLSELGYNAIEAVDGPTAMKILQSNIEIDLLMTDVGLPNGMNGRQIADAARTLRPGLKVMFITGYAENAAIGHGHLEPGMTVITKPFSMGAVATKIKEVLAY